MSGPTPYTAARRRRRYGSAAAATTNDQRLPPAARFHTKRDFGRLFHRQQKASGRDMLLLVAPRRPLRDGTTARARIGVQISVKVAKSAVRRHQLKRWVREWFRITGQHQLAGFDCSIIFRNNPNDHATLLKQLERLTPRALKAEPQPRQHRTPKNKQQRKTNQSKQQGKQQGKNN